jgi:hypothetical protein
VLIWPATPWIAVLCRASRRHTASARCGGEQLELKRRTFAQSMLTAGVVGARQRDPAMGSKLEPEGVIAPCGRAAAWRYPMAWEGRRCGLGGCGVPR